jgi:hypothetical protein
MLGAPDPRRETLKMRVTASLTGHAIRVESSRWVPDNARG